jgi:exopolysaccharide biosynthesis predicted pyruvyltransferase EpsI
MKEAPIKDYLSALPRNERLYYFANPGNAGDAQIALAAYQLFRELGIEYCIVDVSQPFDPAGKTMVYSGGGNRVEYYNTARTVIEKYYPSVKKLVILPHTIRGNEDLLSGFRSNVDIICRERVSYEHVRKHARQANVLLMDDLAFNLDAGSILGAPLLRADGRFRALILRDFLLGFLVPARQFSRVVLQPAEWNTLNAFRKDVESSQRFPRGDSIDLATLFGYGTDSEELAFYVTRRILRTINRYQRIRTDRLHMCIAAAKLGKEVEFFSNNYYKCEAVYRYSIQDRFPHVHWMG